MTGSTSSTVIEATSPSNDGLASSTVIIIVVAVIMFIFLFDAVIVGIIIVIMKKKFRSNYINDTRSKTTVYDDPDIKLKEVKPQVVYDEVKIESTDPVSAADYEVPVTAITEENVDKAMQ
uniref:Uncharacterized protein n=1 Tax=Amphimedon queenslandica TaxID=400682 RepID=A0A1X7SIB9_AMPQE